MAQILKMKENIIEDDKPVHKTSPKGIKGAMDERISIGVLLSRRQRWDCAPSFLLWHLSTSVGLHAFIFNIKKHHSVGIQ